MKLIGSLKVTILLRLTLLNVEHTQINHHDASIMKSNVKDSITYCINSKNTNTCIHLPTGNAQLNERHFLSRDQSSRCVASIMKSNVKSTFGLFDLIYCSVFEPGNCSTTLIQNHPSFSLPPFTLLFSNHSEPQEADTEPGLPP